MELQMTFQAKSLSPYLPADGVKAVESFIAPWMQRLDVEGAMLVGSYGCGLATKFSDIDLYFVLSAETGYRQRGDHVVDNWLLEYNADPVQFIRQLQMEQFTAGNRHCARKVATGRIIFDSQGLLRTLQEEA